MKAGPRARSRKHDGARRFHVIGAPGSGKTTLATQMGDATGLPVYCLDDVARVGGGNGPIRPADERDAMVWEILDEDGWITEGVHLGWVRPLLERAEVIIWMDDVGAALASQRIVRRFVAGAVHEMRSRPTRERFTRFRDYGRQLRSLGGALVEARRYGTATSDPAHVPTLEPGSTAGTWAETKRQLQPFMAKVVHVRSRADAADFVRGLS